jgi:predicted dehydrogenase
MIKVGICGFGYWGPNLLRNFALHPGFQVVAVADKVPARRERVRSFDARLHVYDDAVEMIDHAELDAVAIATPVATHFPLAAHALSRGKHVLVEKPLCLRSSEAEELVAVAERGNLALLVDHVYIFHPAVQMLKELKASGKIGTVTYFDSLRVNLGLFQPDVNVLWDLGPHDLSIMDFLLEEEPIRIEATGYYHVNPGLPDIAYVTAHYKSRMIAHLNLSWMSPVKVRRIAIGGSKQMVVWDDMNNEEKIKIYNSGIDFRPEEQRNVLYRIGDIYSPRVPTGEALTGVIGEFHRTILGDKRSIIDGRAGLRVMRMLETAQAALDVSLAAAGAERKPEARVPLAAAP